MDPHLASVHWVNPARAGMIPRGEGLSTLVIGKPRASGDDPASWPSSGAPRR